MTVVARQVDGQKGTAVKRQQKTEYHVPTRTRGFGNRRSAKKLRSFEQHLVKIGAAQAHSLADTPAAIRRRK